MRPTLDSRSCAIPGSRPHDETARSEAAERLRLTPAWCLRQPLDALDDVGSRSLLRGVLAAGTSIGIYPEGRRNADPWRLAPIRRGAAELALRSGAPLLPIGIRFPARERLGRLPRMGRMILSVGEPLTTPELRRRAADIEPCAAFGQQRIPRHHAADLSQALVSSLAHLAQKSTCS